MSESKEKKKIIRTLECKLHPIEVMQKSERLAEMEGEINRLEKEAASVAKRYRGRLEDLRIERANLSEAIMNKAEMRPVECREVADRYRSEVIMLRNDTNAEVQRRPMTYEEKQDSLFDDIEEIDIPENLTSNDSTTTQDADESGEDPGNNQADEQADGASA